MTRYNRGADTKKTIDGEESISIGFHTIDNAILSYMQNNIDPIVTQDGKQIRVPVIYGNPERWKSVQKDGSIRDNNGKILLPIIMIKRTSVKNSPLNSAVNKYQQYTFQTTWNSRNIYDRFMVLNRVTPSQIYHTTMVPDYYEIIYEAMIWTEYTEQMNHVVENISFESNEYWGETNNYKFLTRIDGFEHITDLPAEADRMVRSKFDLKVRAYILPESALNPDGNRQSTTRMQYSIKKVVFDTEVVSTTI